MKDYTLATFSQLATELPGVTTVPTPDRVYREWASSGLSREWADCNTLTFTHGFDYLLAAHQSDKSRSALVSAAPVGIAKRQQRLSAYSGEITLYGGSGSVQAKPRVKRSIDSPKYLGLPGSEGDATFPTIPKGRHTELYNLRLKLAGRPPVEWISAYWEAVLEDDLPIALTEGLKKAASLIENGMPAIALKGIWMACNKGTNDLRAEIKPYIKYGRVTYVVFDQDAKTKTIVSVKKAITKIGIAIKKASTRFLKWEEFFARV